MNESKQAMLELADELQHLDLFKKVPGIGIINLDGPKKQTILAALRASAPQDDGRAMELIRSARYVEPTDGTAESAWNAALDHIEEGLLSAPPSVAREAVDQEKFCIAFGWAYGSALERKHLHQEPDDGMTPETLWAASDEDSREFMRGVVRDTFAALTRPQLKGSS